MIAAGIALPGAYFLTKSILEFFAFRPEMRIGVLFADLGFILTLALLTIASQTIKAARINPVETLREE